ncbi:hypothetical protein R83H12_00234 [Fibrobacteria bacterium R8-3-H12]
MAIVRMTAKEMREKYPLTSKRVKELYGRKGASFPNRKSSKLQFESPITMHLACGCFFLKSK